MRRLGATLAAAVMIVPLAGCSGGDPISMPDVVGKSLDVAKSDVERAGFDDDVEVVGGGMFGIVVESNWSVCSQEPASGEPIAGAPRLTVDRSCADQDDEDGQGQAESPSETAAPEPEEEPAVVITDISVDKLLDKLNSAGMGGIKVGDQFRLTAELFESDAWGVGASGDFSVFLKAKGGKDDLLVFVEEADTKKWTNGTSVEMVVEMVEVTIDGETTDGWLKAQTVKTLSGGTTDKAKQAAAERTLVKDLAMYADIMNTSLGRTVIDSINPSADGVTVLLNPSMAGVTVMQAQTLITQWNQNIVDALAEAGRGSSDGSVKYFLGGQLVAQNKEILDPWSVDFKGVLDQ
ncbi:hypothetical protein GCM10009641_46820 [Mycobacterium cookii]|uniref:PASTA domain-containing protein n=2 Tax=Nocardioides furvisabuli TaxID=375542 RepID=A0ABN2XNQ3_9ACTN